MQPETAIRSPDRDLDEAARMLRICNACRYCEGYCALFPAMTRRLEFGTADIRYLANLCHHCTACFHACQYAPPHDFDLDFPRAMARVRLASYAEYAWPGVFGIAYRNAGAALALALVAAITLVLALVFTAGGPPAGAATTGFYSLMPHGTMVALFASVLGCAVLSLVIGGAKFWREAGPGPVSLEALAEAMRNALTLKYLDGGHGEGCNEADDAFTLSRRRFHHCTLYGFLCCFAATAVGTVYHYVLRLDAPYGPFSLPVVLGTLGGIGLLIGPGGLLWLSRRRHPLVDEPAQRPMNDGFCVLLLAASATGLALLVLRSTPAMGTLLVLHLGIVLALFALMPFGKFAHAVYRLLALVMYAVERRQPNLLRLGSE